MTDVLTHGNPDFVPLPTRLIRLMDRIETGLKELELSSYFACTDEHILTELIMRTLETYKWSVENNQLVKNNKI